MTNPAHSDPANWQLPNTPPAAPVEGAPEVEQPSQWPSTADISAYAAGTYDPSNRQFGPVPNPPAREILPVLVTPRQWWQKPLPLLSIAVAVALLCSLAVFGIAGALSKDSPQLVSLGGRSAIVGGSNLSLRGDSLDVQGVLGVVSPSVVAIETSQESFRGVFGGSGSGVVIDSKGLILTNSHVVEDADDFEIVFYDGTRAPGTLVAAIPKDDIALVKAEGVTDTLPAMLGTSELMLVGDQVLAIGNALGFGGDPTVTLGILSAKNRELTAGRQSFKNLLQTDAAINPGNSGGPLVNAAGEVIGINTAIIEGSQNIGFAIAMESIQDFLDAHASGDRSITLETAWFGASTQSVGSIRTEDREDNDVEATAGVYVLDVFDGSAAHRAGLKPGDVIVSLDAKEVTTPEDVARAIRAKDPGDSIEIEFDRAGRINTERVSLGTRADADGGN